MIYISRLTHTQQESNISFTYSIWRNVIWIHMLEQKSTDTVTGDLADQHRCDINLQLWGHLSLPFTSLKTVLRTGVIGNILLKRYTLKPGLAFPQNLASSETLAWHFWLGLRFGLFKNVGLKFKKRVLFILSQIFFIEFLLLS